MRTATISQAVILVGGLGTRLGALTSSVPKAILPVGDRPFLAWLMGELVRYGVSEILLLTGHLSDAVRDIASDIAAGLPRPVTIVFSEEPVRAGTGGALFHAKDKLRDRFLLCNGDSFFDTNLAPLLAAAAYDPADVVGRIALRRLEDASRYGTVETDGDRVTAFAHRSLSRQAATINAGIYVFDRRVLEGVTEICSLERDVMPHLAIAGALRGSVRSGYFVDIGVIDDFARAQSELPARMRRPALFLDRDGVINVDRGWVGSPDRFDFIPGALETIHTATEVGWHVFVVTNQSGIARGLYDEGATDALHNWLAEQARLAGGTIDDVRYCPYHPEAVIKTYQRAHDWRKPAPGMILDLIRTWRLDPSRCLLIGDQPTDLQAAAAAGIVGHLFRGGDLSKFCMPLLAQV